MRCQIGEQRDVVTGPGFREDACEIVGMFGRPLGEPSGFEKARERGVGRFVRLRDVGFIERVQAEDAAGRGRRDLPAEELGPDVVDVVEREAHQGMPRRLEGSRCRVECAVALEGDRHEDAVGAVDVRRPHRLVVDHNESFAFLARGFCEQLL